jgi:hypothetical protein
MNPTCILRIARPTDQLPAIAEMYAHGLGFQRLGGFEDHGGFDGIILGHPSHPYHLEFTSQRGHYVGRAPNSDHLLVFYEPDPHPWRAACVRMLEAGFLQVPAYNPYWDRSGRTFEDLDGYRVVLQNSAWTR